MRKQNSWFSSSKNIVHWTYLNSIGSTIPSSLDKSLNAPLMNHLKSLKICTSFDGFNRRVTAMAWHPVEPNTVAVGSKGGDILFWNFEKDKQKPSYFIEGIGPGGSIQSMVFDQRDNGKSIYCASIDGSISLKHFQDNHSSSNIFCQISNAQWELWYTSLDVSFSSHIVLVGSNKGTVSQFTLDGSPLGEKKLHKQKVTHIEFSPKDPWNFVTSSVDRELKVWDIRNIKDKNSCLHIRKHDRPINSAHFSRTDGSSLLTTDQHSQLRIYSCPSFNVKHCIYHPHRQFQHLTPIKATWHPLRDIAVVGRYPDLKVDPVDLRSVDFFDGVTGQLLHQHFDGQAGRKIISLNEFNKQGDKLLSAVGSSVVVWKPNFDSLKVKEAAKEKGRKIATCTRTILWRVAAHENSRKRVKEAELDLSKFKRKKH